MEPSVYKTFNKNAAGYLTYFGTRSWPVWAVTTAGSFEPALGSFVGLWSDELRRALEEGGQRSLEEIQRRAEAAVLGCFMFFFFFWGGGWKRGRKITKASRRLG